jgi:signal peptidase
MTSRVAMAGLIRTTRQFLELGLLVLALTVALAMVFARGAALTGRTVLIVSGPSMEPTIGRGTAIIIEPVPVDLLEVGDVVSIRVGPQQAVFTHRIVRLADRPDGLWIETRGDANDAPDPSIVPASAVMGRVVVAVPSLGYLLTALSSSAGLGLVAGLAGLLLALIWALESLEGSRAVPVRPAGTKLRSPELA